MTGGGAGGREGGGTNQSTRNGNRVYYLKRNNLHINTNPMWRIHIFVLCLFSFLFATTLLVGIKIIGALHVAAREVMK